MTDIIFKRPEEKYIRSYWETVGVVISEKIYLTREENFPFEASYAFVKTVIEKGYPMLFAIDTKSDLCVGWCDASPKGDSAGFVGLGLLPAYRDRGIGTEMLKELIELTKVFGYHKLILGVRESNRRAFRVYEKLGFQSIASDIFQKKALEVGEPIIEMVKIL